MRTSRATGVILAGAAAVAAALVLPGLMEEPRQVQAQDGNMAGTALVEKTRLGKHAYLKRLSLDLRNTTPSWDDYDALSQVEGDNVPLETIDAMLDSSEFLEVMREYHRDLLWANVTNIDYIQFPWALSRSTVGPDDDRHSVYYLRRKGVYFRGGPEDDENDVIPCGHWEATFDELGRPERICDNDDSGRCREGWVWVEPYWNPEEPIKVCAFDAQDTQYSQAGDINCGTRGSRRETTCGCGEGMRFCSYGGDARVEAEVGRSMAEQMFQIIEWVIDENRPYHEILTTRRSFVNGKLSFYLRHQVALSGGVDLEPSPIDPAFLPDMDWRDETWLPVLQGEEHSGILTSYAFMLRFQTNRGRVNRFYNSFLDNFFDASVASDSPDCLENSADLTKMRGCQKCHVAVEPWAAYWARWKQQGGGYLTPSQFPAYDETCETCARAGIGTCPTYCRNEYVVEAVFEDREPYLGFLRGYEFLRENNRINAEAGPRLWVERTIQDGSLAKGIVSKMWKHFMRRPFNSSKADIEISQDLARRFIASDYNLKELIKAIVTHPAYRRVR